MIGPTHPLKRLPAQRFHRINPESILQGFFRNLLVQSPFRPAICAKSAIRWILATMAASGRSPRAVRLPVYRGLTKKPPSVRGTSTPCAEWQERPTVSLGMSVSAPNRFLLGSRFTADSIWQFPISWIGA
jgi:hypothetical protein